LEFKARNNMLRAELLSSSTRQGLKSSSIIRRIFLLGQKRREEFPDSETIDLSLGNPDLEPPAVVLEALRELAQDTTPGTHRYMDNAGFPDVRAAVARHLSASDKVTVRESSVFMTCGAAGALHILMKALLEPGDEVILLAPYFVEYQTYLGVHGAKAVVVSIASGGNKSPTGNPFLPSAQNIASHLTDKTRMLMLNSPNNPSGIVYPEAFYHELAAVLTEHKERTGTTIHVVSDEPYAMLVFPGAVVPSALRCFDSCWLVRSHSKDLGLAGERIGFIAWVSDASDEDVLNGLRAAARAIGFVNAPALMQRLLPRALGATVEVQTYATRARVFCEILQKGGMAVTPPQGTFFALPRTPAGFSDESFCEAAAQAGVLIVPAASFGAPGHFRVSLTQDLSLIERAANILVAVARAGAKPL
jgi:aspartate aminotransferase